MIRIDEVHQNKQLSTAKKGQGEVSNKKVSVVSEEPRGSALRSGTPQKLQTNMSLRKGGLPLGTFDTKVKLLKPSSASKANPILSEKENSQNKEDRAAEFPMKTSERSVKKIKEKEEDKWTPINFQDEEEINRIIMTLI